jgi:nucleoside-diphosphate-sugar epimerase
MIKAKALVTGASGFIGSHLISSLEALNVEIFNLPHRLLTANLTDLENQVKAFNPDVIYHLAAWGNMSNQTESGKIIESNILGTWNLLSASKDIPYKGFINFSTSSVLLPHQTIYSASKASTEALCKAFVDEFKKPIISVRPYSIYGDGEAEFRFIPTVIKALIYNETIDLDVNATHDWVYVKDFINALLNLKIGGVVNMGTGFSYTNLEIVRKLERMSGKKLSYNEKKMRNYDTTGWVCPEHNVTSDLEEGLLKTFTYYAKQFILN